MKLVAILTPSYNRAKLLPRLFNSLLEQTNFNFTWYIVDDGSTDNTSEVVNSFKTDAFKIVYMKKENGGKHTAINKAMEVINEDLTFIVDSDDFLTKNAIETICNDYPTIQNIETICGLGYLKSELNNEVLGNSYSGNEIVDNFINERYNKNSFGDKAEVFKTKILKQYPFPVFENEKFVSESTVWCAMALKYDMKFYNKTIYIAEYQPGGLSDGIKKTLFRNPKGAAEFYLKMTSKPFKLKYKIKYTITYIVYSMAGKLKLSEQFKKANSKFLFILTFIPAYFLFLHRKRIYGK